MTLKDDPSRPEVIGELRLGLKARNQEFLDQGGPNKDKAMEMLLLVNRVFTDDKEFLRESLSAERCSAVQEYLPG